MVTKEENVVLVTASDATSEDVSDAFSGDDIPMTLYRCRIIPELAGFLEQNPIRIVVVDIDQMPVAMLTELSPVIRQFYNTCFVIISSTWDEQLVLDAMSIGARHFMRKSSIQSELVQVIRRLASVGETAPWVQGKVITVLSAGGGCGATTLAVNLANELRLEEKPVLLIDMDLAYGAIATYLDVEGKYGLTDVIGNGNVIDADLIASSTVPYAGGLNVLLSPASVNFSASREIHYEKMTSVLDACRQVYAYTIVDAPRVSPEVAAALASASKITLAVLQMSVKDIRVARKMRDSLLDNGIPGENISLVINRYRKKGASMNLSEMRRAVNCDV
ncbi:MAG: AAA family ATPase, partial [Phycisphaerales bacterium]|nr:AAA family ATPase [Phycisphaerales bacterium]